MLINNDPLIGVARKFVHASFKSFQEVPKNVELQAIDEEHKLLILNRSENFREHLRSLIADINLQAEELDRTAHDREEIADENATLEKVHDTMYSIEKSWQICEIFLLNPTKLLSIELIKWLKVC